MVYFNMSGGRLFSFREGDRSEYLALYMLSALGLVTQVPRQEDIGFDFVCSISEQENVPLLTFNHQYLASIKSLSKPIINLLPPKKWDGKDLTHIKWIFELDLPLILVVVDKSNSKLLFYSTLPIWFLLYEKHDYGAISLIPRVEPTNIQDVGRPIQKEKLENSEKYRYEVDLGYPMCVLTHEDLQVSEKMKFAKERIRLAIKHAQLTIRYSKARVPYFYWFAKTDQDCSRFTPAFYCQGIPNEGMRDLAYRDISPILCSLATSYKGKNDIDLLEKIGAILKLIPKEIIPEQIKKHLSEIF